MGHLGERQPNARIYTSALSIFNVLLDTEQVSLLDLSGSVSFPSAAKYLKEVQILTPP